jgi:uncharacterized protein YndB with AHSA1/START domain
MTRTQTAFEVEMTRVIAAPRDRVYAAWTSADALARWFAPKPFQLVVRSMDFRPGGRFEMSMRGPDGKEFPFSGTYREIVPTERLVWTGEFEDGPAEQQTTEIRFESDGPRTRVHIRQTFHVMTPTIEMAVKGAWQGWSMTLNQLAEQSGDTDRIEQHVVIAAPVERVWRAVTDHREFGAWFRVAIDGPFKVGETSRGRITYPGYEHLEWKAVVKAMEAPRRFAFTWNPNAVDPKVDYSKEEPTLVEFRLEATPTGTLLTVVESGFNRVPAHRRGEAFRSNSGGWAQEMGNVREYVEGRK